MFHGKIHHKWHSSSIFHGYVDLPDDIRNSQTLKDSKLDPSRVEEHSECESQIPIRTKQNPIAAQYQNDLFLVLLVHFVMYPKKSLLVI